MSASIGPLGRGHRPAARRAGAVGRQRAVGPVLRALVAPRHQAHAAHTGGTPWRLATLSRSTGSAAAKRPISSSRSASNGTTASITSSAARRRRSTSSSYSTPPSGDELGPLLLVVDGGDLVGEHGVDRRLGAHHRDLGGGQRQRGDRVERRPAHGVQPGAVRLAHDHADLGHGGLGDGRDHLGPVADDALALDLGADHEAGHVGQEHQRQVEGVAQPDEAGALVGRVDEQHAALLHRVVGHDADGMAVEAGEARRSPRAPTAA